MEAIWEEIEQWAASNKHDIKNTFSELLKNDGDAQDLLKKSRLCGELPAVIAARLFTPELVETTTIFSFDFGLCKWIGLYSECWLS